MSSMVTLDEAPLHITIRQTRPKKKTGGLTMDLGLEKEATILAL